MIENQLTFDFYYGEPSGKGGAIVLNLTVVVAIFGVASRDGDDGIGIHAMLMSDADTGHRSLPLICTTRGWCW